MKFIKPLILFLTILLISLACDRNKTPLAPHSQGPGNLTLQTDQSSYNWSAGEYTKHIEMWGILENKTDLEYFSMMGDGFKNSIIQDPLYFAQTSSGVLEKYNDSQKNWNATDLLGRLSEGSRIILIRPDHQYKVYAYMDIPNEQTESGRYRLRIDYFTTMEPKDGSEIYHDYSNEFLIK